MSGIIIKGNGDGFSQTRELKLMGSPFQFEQTGLRDFYGANWKDKKKRQYIWLRWFKIRPVHKIGIIARNPNLNDEIRAGMVFRWLEENEPLMALPYRGRDGRE